MIVKYIREMPKEFQKVVARNAKRTRSGSHSVYTFLKDGTFEVTGDSYVDILLIGGGGGGGSGAGGGGGGGGFVYRQTVPVTNGVYQVAVGDGGAGAVTNGSGAVAVLAQNGGDSQAFGLVALGGGAGGSGLGGTASPGSSGGSGGGAGSDVRNGGNEFDGAQPTDAAQGNAGGGSKTHGKYMPEGKSGNPHWYAYAGGGGGAGEAGETAVYNYDAVQSTSHPGDGGDGKACSITGREVYYAGGGGGGAAQNYCAGTGGVIDNGGLGGGGKGATYAQGLLTPDGWDAAPGQDGTDGLGGGGGGAGRYNLKISHGGNGGSGVVIIRCRVVKQGFALWVK